MNERQFKILVCPDCLRNLKKIKIRNELSVIGFYCQNCHLIYPVKEEIPILLAKEARNHDLEYPLIKKIKKEMQDNSFSEIQKYITKTLNLLASKKNFISWEWEDEQFWSKEYSREMVSEIQKKWSDRIWEREFLIQELTKNTSLKGKTILSVGCGEGQNFRFLLSKYCSTESLYIASDISFQALKLNRSRNTHKNSMYVLCSADYELPFLDNKIDILCYFGILHHTKNKCNNIQKDKRLIKKKGRIIITESINRPSLRFPARLMFKRETSTHEEFLDKKNIFTQLARSKGFDLVIVREEGTPFFTGIRKLCGKVMVNQKKMFLLFLNIDLIIAKTFGRIFPFFRAGAILLLAKRTSIGS